LLIGIETENPEENKMAEYSEESLNTFLEHQGQLFNEPVAETPEEAEAFLEDCMAAEADTIKDVREYLDEMGMDAGELTDAEVLDQAEVFALPSGRYLIVEG
jgi:predicted AlkP superfamily phosphohydrolase/phosphomutase